jgi:hypothetical protein
VAPREEAVDLRWAIRGWQWLALGRPPAGEAGAGHRSEQKLATIHRLSREEDSPPYHCAAEASSLKIPPLAISDWAVGCGVGD